MRIERPMFEIALPHRRFSLTQETVKHLDRLVADAGHADLSERIALWANELGRRRATFTVIAGEDVNNLLEALCRGRPLPADLDAILTHLTQRLGRRCTERN